MRLGAIRIGDFKSIWQQVVPLDGLVVLFGPNSAGKTNALEAVTSFIDGDESIVRFDRADLEGLHEAGEPPWSGSWLLVELTHADVDGHSDRTWRERLWAGESGRPSHSATHEALAVARERTGAELTASVAQLFAREVAASGPGDPSARLALASAIASSRWFLVDYEATWVLLRVPEMTAVCGAAVSSLARLEPGDLLVDVARAAIDEPNFVLATAVGPGVEREYSSQQVPLPKVRWVHGDFDSLDRDAREFIEQLHINMWQAPAGTVHRDREGNGADTLVTVNDVDLDRLWSPEMEEGRFFPDPWFEMLADDGRSRPVGEGELPEAAWYRVRRTIHSTARALSEYATSVAPSFVREMGAIEIEVLPPTLWAAAPDRVRVVFREQTGHTRDVTTLGSGLARWIATTLRVAGSRLVRARREFIDSSGRVLADEEAIEARRLAFEAASGEQIRLVPSTTLDEVVLVDEPEAHLHPRAVASVGVWLAELSDVALAVLVATHHPWFLGLDRQRLHLVYCGRREGSTALEDIGADLLQSLDRVKDDFGLTRADLLQLTRLALFVEGPHDVAVLEGLFGDELQAAGVRLFPIHGARNALALVTSEVIAALGIRAGVLTDNTRVATSTGPRSGRGPTRRGRTAEESAIDRVVREAAAAGWSLDRFGLTRRDILEYIDDGVCKEVAPRFPGWRVAAQDWRQAGTELKFKEWITRQYGLRLDRRAVGDLVSRMRERAVRPPELRAVVDEILATATRPMT